MKICNEDCFNCKYDDCIQGNVTQLIPVGNSFGERLKRARLLAGMKQKDAADKIGVKTNTFSTWENNRSTPSPAFLKKIQNAFPELMNRG